MIISLVHQKGGAGKTTLSIGLACELERRGFSVLLIDADLQQTASTWLEAAESEEGLPTVLVAPDGQSLRKKGQLTRVSAGFDYTIIDCPPRLDGVTRSAMVKSDVVLVPSPPDAADIWALRETLDVINEAQDFNEELEAYLVINRMHIHSNSADTGRRALKEIAEEAEIPILDTVIHSRVAWPSAMLEGTYVGNYKKGEKAAKELKRLVNELLEKLEGVD